MNTLVLTISIAILTSITAFQQARNWTQRNEHKREPWKTRQK